MFEEYTQAVGKYMHKWQDVVDQSADISFFEGLQPTAIGWKAQDRAELLSRLDALRDMCDQIHFGWVNERWLVTIHLKNLALPHDIRVIKLMERRPGSTDAVGLDHVDFYAPDARVVLENEANIQWNEEKNGEHCKWLSIWFAGTEAKLRGDTVLQVCADEMLDIQEKLLPKRI